MAGVAELTNISLTRGAPTHDIHAVDQITDAAPHAIESDTGPAYANGTRARTNRQREWLSKH